jgi:hypothetical protein
MNNAIQKIATASMLPKVLLICGIIASLLQAGTDIIGGMLWNGYSFTSQAISELTAIGAPTRALLVPFAPIYSALQIAFGLGLLLLIAGQRRTLRIIGVLQVAIGIVALAWMPFPMHMRGAETTFTDTMHNTFAGIQVLLILTSIGLGTIAYGKRFGYYSIGTLVILLALGSLSFLVAGQLVLQQLGNWFGLIERITVYGYTLWVVVLAIVLMCEEKRSQAR